MSIKKFIRPKKKRDENVYDIMWILRKGVEGETVHLLSRVYSSRDTPKEAKMTRFN